MRRNKVPKSYFSFDFNIFKILSIVLIVVFIALIPLVVKKSIKISKIDCQSQFGPCPQNFEFDEYETKSYDYKFVRDQIEINLKNDISVNSYLIQYKIPNAIKIDLNIKSPKNAIYSMSTNKFYLLSSDGIVLSIVDSTDLPKISVENLNLEVGKQIGEKEMFAIKVLSYMSFLFSINEGIIEKNDLRFVNSDGVNIIFPTEGDIDLLVGSIRLIFSRLNDETEGIRMNEIREIDLRYKNPVLRKFS
ncbi:MAG: hypothetical protein WA152_01035 [Microgenomates group bacterium]